MQRTSRIDGFVSALTTARHIVSEFEKRALSSELRLNFAVRQKHNAIDKSELYRNGIETDYSRSVSYMKALEGIVRALLRNQKMGIRLLIFVIEMENHSWGASSIRTAQHFRGYKSSKTKTKEKIHSQMEDLFRVVTFRNLNETSLWLY